MPTLERTVLAAAAARLNPTDLGWLVRIVANPDGDAVLAELDAEARARITPWLCRADNQASLGVKEPDSTPRSPRQRATRRLGGDLFDVPDTVKSSLTPPPVPSYNAGSRSPSVKETAIVVGIRLFMGAGKTEDAARRIVGGMLRDWREGVVYEALAAASQRAHELAEPVGWIRAYVVNNYGPMAARPKHLNAAGPQAPTAPEAGQARRPLATPEALGISPARAPKIEEQNRRVTGSGLVVSPRGRCAAVGRPTGAAPKPPVGVCGRIMREPPFAVVRPGAHRRATFAPQVAQTEKTCRSRPSNGLGPLTANCPASCELRGTAATG